ncbi:MAG: hypothetical protein D6802_07090 [Ardenticatenia bacterium]|nr:MAG: hypothetical protein D6802_07090 [Ardenticatenia bacterium]
MIDTRERSRANMRLLVLVLLLLVLSILGSIWQAVRLGRNVGGTREDVTPYVATYREALEAGDTAALQSMADPNADPAWLAVLATEPRRLWVPLTEWHIERVAELEGTNVVQVSLNGTFDADGVPVSAYWRLYFVQDGEQWQPTFPNVTATWGPQTTLPFAEGIRITYRLDEARDVPPALSDLFTFLEDVRRLTGRRDEALLLIAIDPLEPFEAVTVQETDEGMLIAARSPWTSYGFLAPETELRARIAWGVLQTVETASPRQRAALQAVARFWVGQVNDVHPFFDTALIREAETWDADVPPLAAVLSGEAPATLQTTAYLWLLSEGLTTEQVAQIVEATSPEQIEQMLTAWRGQTPEELNTAWQQAVQTRYRR